MAEKDDANILEQMRRAVEEKPLAEEPLSEETLRDLFQKYNTFLNSLNRQQRALLMNAQVSLKHAAGWCPNQSLRSPPSTRRHRRVSTA